MSDPDDTADRVETRVERPASRPSARALGPPDFGPRYRVEAQIGKGGMGEVYKAYDNDLKCEVALKLVRGDDDDAMARFRREIALARKVTSPNVLRVYDLDEHAGQRFLSMEYVDGEDLAALMRREKRLPLARALAIARQICVGLDAAHAQGVVHRDLKPQNVLVDKQGNVRVADFGLARSLGEAGVTMTGVVMGSPAYMSPEQVKGEPTDERTDIYSFGVMLYQLVTGEPPFQGDTPHAVMEMRLHKTPRSIRLAAPDAPPHVSAIVERCLAVAADARYRSVRDVIADLDAARAPEPAAKPRRRALAFVAAGAVLAAGAIVAALAWPRGEPAGPVRSEPKAVAPNPVASSGIVTAVVLHVDDHAKVPALDLTLTTALEYALRRSLHVNPLVGPRMRAVAAELGLPGPTDDLGKKLAARDRSQVVVVRVVAEAKGSGYTITLSAADATTGDSVFQQTADAANLDATIPAVARLASGLRASLGEPVPEAERDRTGLSSSFEAVKEFAVGGATASSGDAEGAVGHLEHAVAVDPGFALAHVRLAIMYSNVQRLVDQRAQFTLALNSLDRMSERDRLKFLGDYYRTVTEEYDRSIAAYEQLLAKWPRDAPAASNLPLAYQGRGDVKNALEAGRRVAHDYPRDWVPRSNLPIFEFLAGNFEQTIVEEKQFIADFPHPIARCYQYLAHAYLFTGQRELAVAAFDKYVELDASGGVAAAADFAISEGRLADAEPMLVRGIAADQAEKHVDAAEVKQVMLAELRLRRGDKAGALAAAAGVAKEPPRLLQAALVQVAAGDDKHALATAAQLGEDIAPSRRAMAKLIEGEALRAKGKPQQAILAIQDSIHLLDTPLSHLLLARAALDAKLYTEAYSELQACIVRRGEAATDLEDVPSYRYVPLFTYYMAKAQEGLGSSDVVATYQAFLAMTHDPDPRDQLVADARKRVR